MTPAEAAWVRANVWTQAMRKNHAEQPDVACRCQYGPTAHCQYGNHAQCHRATPLPGPIGYVTDKNEVTLAFPTPYAHPHETATGRHPTSLAMVWYADRLCAWACPCTCHARAARMVPARDGALFSLEVT